MIKPILQVELLADDGRVSEGISILHDSRIQAAITIVGVIKNLAEEKRIPEISKSASAALQLLKACDK
jgi:hypothetical protein